jgi:hypothetical protein
MRIVDSEYALAQTRPVAYGIGISPWSFGTL